MLVLGIESSCDDGAAAVVEDGRRILSAVVSNQDEFHRAFRGVVPEIASRRHLETLLPAVETALKDAGLSPDRIDLIAVTDRPGLLGSLLVGVSTAKALALAWNKPLVAVHHLQAHLYTLRMGGSPLSYPFLGLLASGGHTQFHRVDGPLESVRLGGTVDDACGEAFDKVAKHLGLDYPGGPAVERLARIGDAKALEFPMPKVGADDVSFSGLKTAVIQQSERFAKKRPFTDPDVAASFQRTAFRLLLGRAKEHADRQGLRRLGVVGGVSANTAFREIAAEFDFEETAFPPPGLSTDNAAMVAGLGFEVFHARGALASPGSLSPMPRSET